jgi:hypothetical protein
MEVKWLLVLEISTFILSLVLYKSLKKYHLGYFILLSMISATADTIAGAIHLFGWKNNYFVFNIYLIFYTPLTFCAFYPILNYTGWAKKTYLLVAILSSLFIILNYFFMQGPYEFNSYSEVLSMFLAVVVSMLVISKLFTDDDITLGLIDNPYFWVTAGTLVFSLGAMFVLGLQQFIAARNIKLLGVNVYRIILPILNIFLCGGYCYSFILCRKLTNRQLQ